MIVPRVLCLYAASSFATAGLPTPPLEYSAVIEVSMPYIGLKMPLRVLTSKTTQKIEYHDGLEIDVASSKGTYKYAFNNSARVCMFQPATSGPTQVLETDVWQPQMFVPNLTTYTQEADELVGGIMCNKYTLTATHGSTGVMNDVISFYWDAVLAKPVRWHQHARGLPFGSHTDEYILDYLSFQSGAPAQQDLALPDKACEHPVAAEIEAHAATWVGTMHTDTAATKRARFVELLNRQHAGNTRFVENAYAHMRFRGKRQGSSISRRTTEHQKYVSVHTLTGKNLPKDFDWRITQPGVVGPVKDQAMCGSCWTYGAIGPIESIKAIQTGELVTLPEQFMLDCAWTGGNSSSPQNMGCDGGDSDIGVLEIVRKFGGIVPTATAYGSYLATNGYCKDIRSMEVGAKVSGWTDVPKHDDHAFMDALVANGPISVSIMVPDEMLYFDSGVLDVASCKCDEDQIDHAVEVVGYGVDASGKGYWTVRNSWSTYWGDQGYIKVAQGANDCCISAQAGYPIVDAKAQSQATDSFVV